MSDAELFTRLFYYGTVQLGMSEERFWLCPFGLFLDLWTAHKQWLGREKPLVLMDEESFAAL